MNPGGGCLLSAVIIACSPVFLYYDIVTVAHVSTTTGFPPSVSLCPGPGDGWREEFTQLAQTITRCIGRFLERDTESGWLVFVRLSHSPAGEGWAEGIKQDNRIIQIAHRLS
jgi:hypothetical protein